MWYNVFGLTKNSFDLFWSALINQSIIDDYVFALKVSGHEQPIRLPTLQKQENKWTNPGEPIEVRVGMGATLTSINHVQVREWELQFRSKRLYTCSQRRIGREWGKFVEERLDNQRIEDHH